jgi:hypothetical protein
MFIRFTSASGLLKLSFRYSAVLHFLAYLKTKKEKKLSNKWGLMLKLILILRDRGLQHVVDNSEKNSDSGISELQTSSSGLQ